MSWIGYEEVRSILYLIKERRCLVTFVSFICGTFVSFIAEKVWTLWFNLRRAFQTWLAQIKTAISKGKQRGQHQFKTFFVDYSSWRNCFNRQFPCCLMCVWHILPFQSPVYRGKQWILQLALRLWQWGGLKCQCCVTRKSFRSTSISKLFDFANCIILITQLPKNGQTFNIILPNYNIFHISQRQQGSGGKGCRLKIIVVKEAAWRNSW